MMLALVWTLLAIALGGYVGMRIISPGTLPLMPGQFAISEKVFVTINGVRQGMFIRGRDRRQPVILFLHGGPAMPEYGFSQRYPGVLEMDFVVCWWEQRGSGLSFSRYIPAETLSETQLIADTITVTDYLRDRFHHDKIFLLAHSAGSFFGLQAAAQAPERYHAYIGMGQITRQMDSEKLAYNYMLKQFSAVGNRRMVNRLSAIPFQSMGTMPKAYYSVRDQAMHLLGIGTTHRMRSAITGVFLPVMQSRAYTLTEKFNIWRGKLSPYTTAMWNEILDTDLTEVVSKLEVPVYFMSGKYDYTVSQALARQYLEELQAPSKGFYTFGESAHSPLFEEPEKFRWILLKDVVNGKTTLADSVTLN